MEERGILPLITAAKSIIDCELTSANMRLHQTSADKIFHILIYRIHLPGTSKCFSGSGLQKLNFQPIQASQQGWSPGIFRKISLNRRIMDNCLVTLKYKPFHKGKCRQLYAGSEPGSPSYLSPYNLIPHTSPQQSFIQPFTFTAFSSTICRKATNSPETRP